MPAERATFGEIMSQSFVNEAGRYVRTTRDITVSVLPIYLEEQSTPEASHFVWAYHVRIENHGAAPVQLMRRHWQITDSSGNFQEVRGEGVVGEQPVLGPGEAFEYTSGTPLPTPSGIMVGSYQMTTETGEQFDIAIPAFSLDSPYARSQIH